MLNIDIQQKYYQDCKILDKLQIEAKKGEIICIVGPSGCGKTTLLRLVASLDQDYQGMITYEGNNTIDELGFIFQDSRLLPWLNVKENILLVSKSKDEKQIEALLEEVGLKEYMNHYIKELSGGMKRRVSIVRAFINQPKLLLLDEPFISLDHPTAQGLRKTLLSFYEKSPSNLLFVTHDLSEALAMADRIIFLSKQPSSIIYEYENCEKSFDEQSVALKKEALLKQYPHILSGSTT